MKKGLSATLALSSVLLMLLSLTLGPPSNISLANTIAVLTGGETGGNQSYIIWQLRLPRILASFFSGAILGCAGTVFQAALRNPMADPFVLGISSGASFGGVALALFIGLAPPLLGFPLSALLGATLTTLFIVGGMSLKRKSSNTTLLLTGVAVNYILSAAMTLLMFLHREQYQRILYWTLGGSFSTSTYAQVGILIFTFLLLFALLRANHQNMDMLLLDEASAHAGGLAVGKTRLMLLLAGSAASAICVSYFGGVIGFIGLMAPPM